MPATELTTLKKLYAYVLDECDMCRSCLSFSDGFDEEAIDTALEIVKKRLYVKDNNNKTPWIDDRFKDIHAVFPTTVDDFEDYNMFMCRSCGIEEEDYVIEKLRTCKQFFK